MSERTHRQLRTLSTGLVVYGVVGIILAVVMLGAVVAISGRLDSLAGRVSDRLGTISTTVDKTATALDRAASTSGSFAATIGQAGPTLQKVDSSLGEVIATLRELETTAAAVSFLGQTPLASLSGRFGTIADQLETLQGQVSTLGGNLADNQANLAALGTSLTDLAAQLRQVNEILGSGEIEASLGEIVSLVRLALALLAVWFAVPAIAALVVRGLAPPSARGGRLGERLGGRRGLTGQNAEVGPPQSSRRLEPDPGSVAIPMILRRWTSANGKRPASRRSVSQRTRTLVIGMNGGSVLSTNAVSDASSWR